MYLWSPVFPVMLKVPKARSEHTACVYQGALYILGGRGACSPFKDFWKYDLGGVFLCTTFCNVRLNVQLVLKTDF